MVETASWFRPFRILRPRTAGFRYSPFLVFVLMAESSGEAVVFDSFCGLPVFSPLRCSLVSWDTAVFKAFRAILCIVAPGGQSAAGSFFRRFAGVVWSIKGPRSSASSRNPLLRGVLAQPEDPLGIECGAFYSCTGPMIPRMREKGNARVFFDTRGFRGVRDAVPDIVNFRRLYV